MSDYKELGSSLGLKVLMQNLDELMKNKGIEPDTREMIINSMEMMYEYVPYTIAQGKNPTDGKVLAEFLTKKMAKTLKYFGSDGTKCAAAIVEFLISSKDAYLYGRGALPAAVLAYGLALLDLIEVGNSCEPVQKAYYEAVLRESSVATEPVRSRVVMP